MANVFNNGTATGNLAADPRFFQNRDGSETVRFTLFAPHNWKSKDGNRGSDPIEFEGFVRAGAGRGVYAHIGKGDRVTISYRLAVRHFTDKNGEAVYKLTATVEEVGLLDSKATAEQRRGRTQAQTPVAPVQPIAQPVAQQAAPAQPQQQPAYAYAGEPAGQEYLPFS